MATISCAARGMTRRLLLAGAGHAHVEVLRAFGRLKVADVEITLITREPASPYSGMLPGVIAGHYRRAEAEIAVADLAAFAGARLVIDEVVSIDPEARLVHRKAGEPLGYDVVSLDLGSRPSGRDVPGVALHAVPVKPIDRFFARFSAVEAACRDGLVRRVVLVGGGAGGVELLLAVAHRMRGLDVALTLLTAGETVLPGFSGGFRARVMAALAAAGIVVRTGARVVAVREDAVELADGARVAAEAVLWTTQADAATFLSRSGLACDAKGFLKVDAMLRAVGREDVFAAGDMVSFVPRAIPKSGVYAVRAGPVLAANLRAALSGDALRAFQPQRRSLVILATGGRHAVATGYGVTVEGDWVWRWKDRIDRRFMARYRPGGFDA